VSWDPYLDLEAGVLRNRLGLTDPEQLRRAEAGLTAVRLAQLATRPLPGLYDLEHLQAFHRLIFGEVYDWAGELRSVNIGKGALFCPPDDLKAHAAAVFERLARADHLRGRPRAAFVDGLAAVLAEINSLHPFREGNGRAQRAFLSQLARTAGHPVRWAAMDPAENIDACRAAHLHGDPGPLRAMLNAIVG
jgi:cell filamentation protein